MSLFFKFQLSTTLSFRLKSVEAYIFDRTNYLLSVRFYQSSFPPFEGEGNGLLVVLEKLCILHTSAYFIPGRSLYLHVKMLSFYVCDFTSK